MIELYASVIHIWALANEVSSPLMFEENLNYRGAFPLAFPLCQSLKPFTA